MSYKPFFKGKIESGNLHITRSREFKNYIKKFEGKEIVLTIEPKSSVRTLAQNSYLWGVVYKIISDYTGFTTQEIHEVCKKKFLYYEKMHKNKSYGFTKSTTGLNKMNFSDYIERIKVFAAETFNLNIPSPEDIETII